MERAHQYDAFLSYNRDDIEFVRDLAEQLDTRYGITTFFAERDLRGGMQWQTELERALGRSRTCVVCVGSGPLGPWQSKEVRAAIQEQVEKETVGIIPVLIPGADKAVFKDLPAFLKQSHGFTFSSPGDQETLDRLAASILG